jgi:hypothetical protein
MALLIFEKMGVKIAELIGHQKPSCLMIKVMSVFDDNFVPFFLELKMINILVLKGFF